MSDCLQSAGALALGEPVHERPSASQLGLGTAQAASGQRCSAALSPIPVKDDPARVASQRRLVIAGGEKLGDPALQARERGISWRGALR